MIAIHSKIYRNCSSHVVLKVELIRGIGRKGSLKAAGMRQDAQMTHSQFQHMPHMFHVPVRYVEKISNVESSRGTGGRVSPPLSNFSVLGLRQWSLYPVYYAVLRGWCPDLH